jgi:transmembrane sensor
LLARYLASEASAEERATVEAWAARHPDNAAELARLERVWRAPPGRPRDWDINAAWASASRRIDGSASRGGSEGAHVRPIPARRAWHAAPLVRIAATVLAVAGLAYLATDFGWLGGSAGEVFATATGESKTFDLPDSTRVVLGPASELRIASQYGTRARRVDLRGEAWFEVRHDSAAPFRVHAQGTVTEDLGTAFSVRALEGDSLVRVVVAEGSAAVWLEQSTGDQRATLRARDAVTINIVSARAHITRDAEIEPLLAWRAGRIEFSNAALSTVAVELQRWFGVSVRFERPDLAGRTLSYSMSTTDLGDAIEVLSRSTGVTIERKADTLFVR